MTAGADPVDEWIGAWRLYSSDPAVTLYHGDAIAALDALGDNSIDAVVCDPPYGLTDPGSVGGFMGATWDARIPGPEYWAAALRVCKPGGHLIAFGGTRTYHRLTVAIEDAGWQIRDCLMWLYGTGFPKSLDISKAIDRRGGANVAWFGPFLRLERERRGITQRELAEHFRSRTGGLTGCVANWELGFNLPTPEQFNRLCAVLDLPFAEIAEAERDVIARSVGTTLAVAPGEGRTRSGVVLERTAPGSDAARAWSGWGTALKPAWEPIVLARKPPAGSVAANVLTFGTGAINVDACRIPIEGDAVPMGSGNGMGYHGGASGTGGNVTPAAGRWPANVLLDEAAAAALDAEFGDRGGGYGIQGTGPTDGRTSYALGGNGEVVGFGDSGGASRFFYTSKALGADRHEGAGRNIHPTVKPTDLMRWLVRLVTPAGGVVLDPFMGSGSTGRAAVLEDCRFVGVEITAEYLPIAAARIASAQREPRLPFGAEGSGVPAVAVQRGLFDEGEG